MMGNQLKQDARYGEPADLSEAARWVALSGLLSGRCTG